jgi:hypothetical protein
MRISRGFLRIAYNIREFLEKSGKFVRNATNQEKSRELLRTSENSGEFVRIPEKPPENFFRNPKNSRVWQRIPQNCSDW